MPYIDPKVVLEAKKMNLLTILKNFEPHELVRLDKNNYTTRTHDSFIEVVETITGKQVVVAPKPIKQDNKYYERPLLLYRFSSL